MMKFQRWLRLGKPSSLSTLDAYERWAESYPPVAHNPLMRAEQAAMLARWPELHGRRALDLACGTGRYAQLMRAQGAAFVLALDFSFEMLRRASMSARARASMMRLPLRDHVCDVIVSGLAVGHADDLQSWMCECARVLQLDGVLLYSDFHARATQTGLTRSFRGGDGRHYTVPHQTYTLAQHQAAARAAGLHIESAHEVRAGIELRELFDGSDDFYRRWHGLPLVLVVRARKVGLC